MFRKVPKEKLGSASGRQKRGAVVAAGIGTIGILLVLATPLQAQKGQMAPPTTEICSGDNGGITLSPGFCATVFADNLGHARHMAVAPNGVVYVNTWSGRYYVNDKPPPGGFLVALQDTKGDGHADVIRRFGPGVESGNAGGTGIALYKGALYVETNDRIVRYALPPGAITPSRDPDVIVSGLPLTGDHPMHPPARKVL
jgi:glucose/arabinose dehydrogenase